MPITVFTRARLLSVSEPNESTPRYPISLTVVLMLYSNLLLSLPSSLFISGFPTKILWTLFFSPVHVTCPALVEWFCVPRLQSDQPLMNVRLCSIGGRRGSG